MQYHQVNKPQGHPCNHSGNFSERKQNLHHYGVPKQRGYLLLPKKKVSQI